MKDAPNTRTFNAPGGPLTFAFVGEVTSARVLVGGCARARLTLTTQDPPDGPARRVIADAVMTRTRDGVQVKLPRQDTGITVTSRGGGSVTSMHIGNAGGGVVVTGADVTIVGSRAGANGPTVIGPGAANVAVSTGVMATLHLPSGSTLRADTGSGAFNVVAGPAAKDTPWLAGIEFDGRNTGLDVNVRCQEICFDSRNGDLGVFAVVRRVEAATHNGAIALDALHGDARARTHNGGVTIAAMAPGKVTAKTHNGGIWITDPNRIGPDRLRISANSHNGRVRTPH